MADKIQGSTVIPKLTIKDADGVLFDPDTSTKITITEKDSETEVVSDQDMTQVSTGIYTYDWKSPANATIDRYCIEYTTIDGTRTTKLKDAFNLVEGCP